MAGRAEIEPAAMVRRAHFDDLPIEACPTGQTASGVIPPFAISGGSDQWAISTGTSACSSMLRVAPPKIASRKREWP